MLFFTFLLFPLFYFNYLKVLTQLATSSPEVSVFDEPAKLTVIPVIVNVALPAETVTFSALATVALNITTSVALVTENPIAIAPEYVTASAAVE
jgi:hypothetical protein